VNARQDGFRAMSDLWTRISPVPPHEWLERDFVPSDEDDIEEHHDRYVRHYPHGLALSVDLGLMGFSAIVSRDGVRIAQVALGEEWTLQFQGWHDSRILRVMHGDVDTRISYAPLPEIIVTALRV
jgi:hypothetical protein